MNLHLNQWSTNNKRKGVSTNSSSQPKKVTTVMFGQPKHAKTGPKTNQNQPKPSKTKQNQPTPTTPRLCSAYHSVLPGAPSASRDTPAASTKDRCQKCASRDTGMLTKEAEKKPIRMNLPWVWDLPGLPGVGPRLGPPSASTAWGDSQSPGLWCRDTILLWVGSQPFKMIK